MQVLVRDNNVDQALRVLKKKMQREGFSVRSRSAGIMRSRPRSAPAKRRKPSAAPANKPARPPSAKA